MDKKLKYKLLANFVVTVHLALVTFIVLSIPIIIIFPNLSMVILLFCLLIIVIGFIWGGCPVTDLEKTLIKKYDPKQVYREQFIVHKLEKFLKIKTTNNQVKKAGYVLLVVLFLCTIRAYFLN